MLQTHKLAKTNKQKNIQFPNQTQWFSHSTKQTHAHQENLTTKYKHTILAKMGKKNQKKTKLKLRFAHYS